MLAVAAGWWCLALLRPQPWWRGEVAFGIACALAGGAHLLLVAVVRDRRTVVR